MTGKRRMKAGLAAIGLGAVALLATSSRSGANIGGNERVSVTTSGGQITGSTYLLDLSPSAQYAAFASTATQLGVAANTGNGVFVRDRFADTTTRVDTGTGTTSSAAISDDGRYVLYVKGTAINLLDRTSGATTWIGSSNTANQYNIAISGDGSTIAYTLSNGNSYVRSTSSGAVTAVGTGNVFGLSSTGRYLVWKTTASTAAYRLDLQTSTSELISRTPQGYAVAALKADISADGSRIVFETIASGVVAADTDATTDLYLWDGGVFTHLTPEATGTYTEPSISADGSTVSYYSMVSNLGDVIVRPVGGAPETALSRIDGAPAVKGAAWRSRLSADGRYVGFQSADAGLAVDDTNGVVDMFVRDRTGDLAGPGAGTIAGVVRTHKRAPIDGARVTATGPRGTFTTFTASDGSFSFAPLPSGRWKLDVRSAGRTARTIPTSGGWVYLYDGETEVLDPVSMFDRDTRPAAIVTRADDVLADGASSGGSISADGRYVGFTSTATNLVPGDTNGVSDVFVADRTTGAVARVSLSATGAQLSAPSTGGDLSDDGRRVLFATAADGVTTGDADALMDAFVRDLDASTNAKATLTVSSTLRRPSDGTAARLSGDGSYLAYPLSPGFALGRVDGSGTPVVASSYQVVHSLGIDGSVVTAEGSAGTYGNTVVVGGTTLGVVTPVGTSRNGRWVAKSKYGKDIEVIDRQTGLETEYRTRWGGLTSSYQRGSSGVSSVQLESLSISDDGRYVLATGTIAAVEPLSDRNVTTDVFLLDTQTNDMRRVSIGNDRTEIPGATKGVDLSADGRTALVSGTVTHDDTNGVADLVVIDLTDDFTGVHGTGQLSGTVTSEGQPVAGALVRALIGTERVARTTTAADGTWTIAGLRPETYRVKVDDLTNTRPGRFAPSARRVADAATVEVIEGGAETVDVTLPAAPSVPPAAAARTKLTKQSVATLAPAVSANGRFVAFASGPNGLVLKDRIMEVDRRVDDGAASGSTTALSISDDGQEVVFVSSSPSLVAGDTNGRNDVFRYDLGTGTVSRIGLQPNGSQFTVSATSVEISGDGEHVSFVVSGTLYRWDAATGVTTAVATGVSTTETTTSLSFDGSVLAYASTAGPRVVTGAGTSTVSTLPGRIHNLSADGTELLWAASGAVTPGSPDTGAWGLFLTDLSSGASEQVDVGTGGVESSQGTGVAQLSGDGTLVVFEAFTKTFDTAAESRSGLWVRDLDEETTVPSKVGTGPFGLSSEADTLVVVDQGLWVGAVRAVRPPPSPTITLFGPQGAGVATVWQPAKEQPSLPTEVLLDRFEDGGSTPVESVVLPYDPAFGLHVTPTVPPGSTQRVELRFRNANGTSARAVSPTLATVDNATVDVTLTGPDGPVPYAAVVAYNPAGQPVTFGATAEEGTTSLSVQPGSYRLRAFASDLTPYLDGWYGGGPTATGGVLTVPAGATSSIEIPMARPGSVTPVSYYEGTGLLDIVGFMEPSVDDLDLSPDGRYAGFSAGSSLMGTTQVGGGGYVRDLQTGRLTTPCEMNGGVDGGTDDIALSDEAAFVARKAALTSVLTRCNRATGQVDSLRFGNGNTSLENESLHISDDGSVIVFAVAGQSTLVAGDAYRADVFAWRPDTGDVRRLTLDSGSSTKVTSMTADGTKATVLTDQVLNPADTFGDTTLYLVDTTTGAATIASVHPVGGSAHATAGVVTPDGSTVVFVSRTATLPGSAAGASRAYRYRPATGSVIAASGDGAGRAHVGDIGSVSVTADGNQVAYTVAEADSLDVVGSDAGSSGAYLYDIPTGRLEPIDVATSTRATSANNGVTGIEINRTGTAAVFTSTDGLIPIKPGGGTKDAYYWTRAERPAYVPIIREVVQPNLRIPTDVVAVAGPGGSADVSWATVATDDVDGDLPVTCGKPPGSTFALGTTTFWCGAIDAAGNARGQQVRVRVVPQAATAFSADTASCAVLADGSVSCYGTNNVGQAGRGTASGGTLTAAPVVNLPQPVIAIAGSDSHHCALDTAKDVYCWGAGADGQNGTGFFTLNGFPSWVTGGVSQHAVGISSGMATTCALLDDGTVKCWGDSTYGQIGSGTTVDQATPQTVTGITTATQVATSGQHSCALLADTTLRCWGLNSNGELGTGNQVPALTPVAVAGLSGVAEVTTGRGWTCARLLDGTARCWGASSRLGDGTNSRSFTPKVVTGLADVIDIQAYAVNTCAIRSDHTAWCWGSNPNLELGAGTGTGANSPVQVIDMTDAASLGNGTSPCMVLQSGTVRCTKDTNLGERLPYPPWVFFL